MIFFGFENYMINSTAFLTLRSMIIEFMQLIY